MKLIFCLLPLLCIGHVSMAQKEQFGDRALFSFHYGVDGDGATNSSAYFDIEHFMGFKAGVLLLPNLYGGIQTRLIRARAYDEPFEGYYMAGMFVRGYLLHPARPNRNNWVGIFLESGFMMGNYGFEYRNGLQRSFEKPGSWYIPSMLGMELRVWKKLTVEGGMHLYYNDGGNWNEQGIGYVSAGVNWHW